MNRRQAITALRAQDPIETAPVPSADELGARIALLTRNQDVEPGPVDRVPPSFDVTPPPPRPRAPRTGRRAVVAGAVLAAAVVGGVLVAHDVTTDRGPSTPTPTAAADGELAVDADARLTDSVDVLGVVLTPPPAGAADPPVSAATVLAFCDDPATGCPTDAGPPVVALADATAPGVTGVDDSRVWALVWPETPCPPVSGPARGGTSGAPAPTGTACRTLILLDAFSGEVLVEAAGPA